jgi:hypothetical protein
VMSQDIGIPRTHGFGVFSLLLALVILCGVDG